MKFAQTSFFILHSAFCIFAPRLRVSASPRHGWWVAAVHRSPSYEAAQVLFPPGPVVAEDAGPELGVMRDAFRTQKRGEGSVLVDEGIVLAGGNHPADAGNALQVFAVHIRNVSRGAMEIAGVIPVPIQELMNV